MACAFRDWLPSVLQSVKPYVSAEDIDKGARWSTDIAQELKESSFGLICVTRDNLQAPWVNFEAGALSKTFEKAKVCPLLFNVKRSEVQGPLLQFQSVIYEKEEIEKLVLSINNCLPDDERLEDARLKKVFGVWWPELKAQLDSLKKEEPQEAQPKSPAAKESSHLILEELLELSRNQTKLLRSPTDLLPPGYLEDILRHMAIMPERRLMREEETGALDFLQRRARDFVEIIEKIKEQPEIKTKSSEFAQLVSLSEAIMDVTRFLSRNTAPTLDKELVLEKRKAKK